MGSTYSNLNMTKAQPNPNPHNPPNLRSYKWYQSRSHGFEPQGCRWGGDCWQIGGLTVSINFPCVRRGCLGECTIRLGYGPFLTAIAFRRVGSAWGPTGMNMHKVNTPKNFRSKLASDVRIWKMVGKNTHRTLDPRILESIRFIKYVSINMASPQ